MDWKNRCAPYLEKAKKLWAAFLVFCGKAREWTRKFLTNARAWILEFLEKARVWLADARVWLRKAWNIVNIWLTKAKVWLQKAGVFLGDHSKKLLGWLAVLALKIRKWIRKTTASLRSWWAQSKGRKWLEAKREKIRERLPAPNVPAQITAPEPAEEVVEEIADPIPVQAPPVRPAPRRRKLGPVATTLLAIWNVIKNSCVWVYCKRKYIMAAPVAFYAVKLALANAKRLPDTVGLDIQASGEFARMVSRQSAVLGPLGITAFCLVLVLCSRKPLLPWLISIFTLILPILIWMTNYYA